MANNLKLSEQEIKSAFTEGPWAERFPPVLTIDQASELIQVPKSTLYDWRSRGLLGRCSRRVGKRVLFVRDRLLQQIFNEGLVPND